MYCCRRCRARKQGKDDGRRRMIRTKSARPPRSRGTVSSAAPAPSRRPRIEHRPFRALANVGQTRRDESVLLLPPARAPCQPLLACRSMQRNSPDPYQRHRVSRAHAATPAHGSGIAPGQNTGGDNDAHCQQLQPLILDESLFPPPLYPPPAPPTVSE